MGITESKSQVFILDEKAALYHKRKTKEKKDGWHEMGIPWRNGEPSFDDNYETALSRLKKSRCLKKALKYQMPTTKASKPTERKGTSQKCIKQKKSSGSFRTT